MQSDLLPSSLETVAVRDESSCVLWTHGNQSAFAVHSLKPALKLSYEQTGDLLGYLGSDLHHSLMSFLRTVLEPVIPQR